MGNILIMWLLRPALVHILGLMTTSISFIGIFTFLTGMPSTTICAIRSGAAVVSLKMEIFSVFSFMGGAGMSPKR